MTITTVSQQIRRCLTRFTNIMHVDGWSSMDSPIHSVLKDNNQLPPYQRHDCQRWCALTFQLNNFKTSYGGGTHHEINCDDTPQAVRRMVYHSQASDPFLHVLFHLFHNISNELAQRSRWRTADSAAQDGARGDAGFQTKHDSAVCLNHSHSRRIITA